MADPGPNQEGSDDEEPISVPSHAPLPLPPEVSFTRPTLGRPPPVSSASQRLNDTGGGAGSGFTSLGASMAAGVTFVASVIAGLLIGQWIDHRWSHQPWGTIVFTLLGVAAGFLNLFRVISATDRSGKK